MTLLEFWGCALIAFGPPLAMFSLTVASDPIKVILLISSSFFWLLSFLTVAVCWSIISLFCDYLIIGAYLAVLSQEIFRYLFHVVTKKAQTYLAKLLTNEELASEAAGRNEIMLNADVMKFHDKFRISYVSGLGFGLMNSAFALMNVLTDHIGPGTVGLKGDSHYFLLVSALTALAFTLLNVAWSVIMSQSVETSDKRLAVVVLVSHLLVTSVTFVNRINLQLISILVVYATTILCGLGALQVTGVSVKQLTSLNRRRSVDATT
uniref:Gamma-secretase subunit Aph-1 n=1 Tax=Aceria tosichella TaxID=561515 RepID=A0A6G1SFM6_9ACAR